MTRAAPPSPCSLDPYCYAFLDVLKIETPLRPVIESHRHWYASEILSDIYSRPLQDLQTPRSVPPDWSTLTNSTEIRSNVFRFASPLFEGI